MTGMYQVKNNRRLARQLVAHVCARPAIIVDLCDAAAFIDMHGDRTRLWVTAEIGVKCADRPPPDRPSHQDSRKRTALGRHA